MADTIKAGSRNSREDRGRIREIRKAAGRVMEISRELEPSDEDEPDALAEAGLKGDIVLNLPEAVLSLSVVKAAGEWVLEVLGVPFGGPSELDAQRQYFTRDTQTFKDVYKSIPVLYYHSVTPDGKSLQPKPIQIGVAEYDRTDEQGHWYKVALDRASEFVSRVWEAAKQGILRASSGSLSHMVRIGRGGEITSWPVAELSLIDEKDGRRASNPRAVAIPVMKAVYDAAKIEFVEIQPEAEPAGDERPAAADNEAQTVKSVIGVIEMDEKELLELLDKRDAEKAAAAVKAKEAADIEALRKENEALKAASRRLPTGVVQAKFAPAWKYDNTPTEDLLLVAGVLGGKMNGMKTGNDINDIARAIALRVMDGGKTAAEKETGHALKAAGFALKSDEVMQQDLASYGDEWVGVGYGTQLWEAVRNQTQVLSKIPQQEIPQGQETFYDPTEGADPTWYKVAETTANDSTMLFPVASVTSSKAGTGRSAETLAKAGARVLWSGELNEDSLIPMASELRRKLAVSGAEQLEHAVIDGDTDANASTNINDIAGTPAGTEMFMTVNGFRKLALVTNTANSRSAAGGFVAEDFLETAKLLGVGGVDALDLMKVGMLIDVNTHWKALTLPEVKTRDVNTAATVENGRLTRIYGYDVMASPFMHKAASTSYKANSAGKIDLDTPGNNLYGAILAVRWDRWKFGWKRRATIETERIARSDAYEIVALMRFGLKYFSTEACAITYYVGV